jgi:hypothetical protein
MNPVHILILSLRTTLILSSYLLCLNPRICRIIQSSYSCNWPLGVSAVDDPAQSMNICKQLAMLTLLTTKSEPASYIMHCHMDVRGNRQDKNRTGVYVNLWRYINSGTDYSLGVVCRHRGGDSPRLQNTSPAVRCLNHLLLIIIIIIIIISCAQRHEVGRAHSIPFTRGKPNRWLARAATARVDAPHPSPRTIIFTTLEQICTTRRNSLSTVHNSLLQISKEQSRPTFTKTIMSLDGKNVLF